MAILTLLACLILPACHGLSHHSRRDDLVVPETYLADRRDLEVDLSSLDLMVDIGVAVHIDSEGVRVVDFADGLVANKDYHVVDADKNYMVLVIEDWKVAG